MSLEGAKETMRHLTAQKGGRISDIKLRNIGAIHHAIQSSLCILGLRQKSGEHRADDGPVPESGVRRHGFIESAKSEAINSILELAELKRQVS